jgi:uncharacterized protein (UPF0332 family)
MITENERDVLIEYRLKQAIESIELAKFLLSSDKLVVAVNRIYYGMYYALTALALKHSFETSKHTQLIGWFNKDFIFNKKVDPKFGRILKEGYQNRTKGDYEAFVLFSKDEVELMLIEMADFIQEIKNILEKV